MCLCVCVCVEMCVGVVIIYVVCQVFIPGRFVCCSGLFE